MFTAVAFERPDARGLFLFNRVEFLDANVDSKTDLILNADDRLLISTYDNVLNEYREPTEVFVTKRGFRTAIADADSDAISMFLSRKRIACLG